MGCKYRKGKEREEEREKRIWMQEVKVRRDDGAERCGIQTGNGRDYGVQKRMRVRSCRLIISSSAMSNFPMYGDAKTK